MHSNRLIAAAWIALAAGAAHAQDFVAAPSVEMISLVDGFGSRSVTVQSGAAENESPIAASCGGAISRAAQAHFFYTSGAHALSITATAQAPVSLLIADPQGNWHCQNGQSESANITFDPAPSGRYAIWVGAIENAASATITAEEQNRQ